jgi:hypothetical protein
MSQYPNIPPQQAYDGRPTSSGDESPSLNPMPNPLPGGLPNIPTYPGSASNPPVPAPAYPFGTEHIQQLADFHQQQRQPNQPQQDQQVVQPQQMQQYLQATHQPVSSHQIQMQQMQRYQQQQQPPVQQPQRTIAPQQARPVTPQQQPQVRLPPPSPSQQSRQTQPIQQHHNFHPALLSNHAVPTGQPQARLHNAIRRPSIPGSQVYTPPVQRLRLPSPIKAEPPAGPSKPTPRRPSPADGREKDKRPRPAPSGATQAVYFAIREPTAREHTHEDRQREREMGRESRVSPAPGEVRRRRDEGMRGSMRNESGCSILWKRASI